MNWNLSTGIWPPPKGKGKSTVVCAERRSSLSLESPVASAEMETGLLASRSQASFPRDDPRVVAALEAYLEALRGGRGWSRDEFLAQHFEISEVLGQCLSGLEFIQAAAVQLEHSRPFLAGDAAGASPSGLGLETTGSSARSVVAAWASSTRPSRSRSDVTSP